MEKNTKVRQSTRALINVAWARNGDGVVTGEPLILACLMHTTGGGRNSKDMETVQRLMKDINLKD